MTTFESAITRAEADLANVQSALDTAQQVLEVADRAHGTGRRLVKLIRIAAIVLAIGGIAVGVVVLLDRFSRTSDSAEGPEATDATPVDQIQATATD
jgi:hypothetical protein